MTIGLKENLWEQNMKAEDYVSFIDTSNGELFANSYLVANGMMVNSFLEDYLELQKVDNFNDATVLDLLWEYDEKYCEYISLAKDLVKKNDSLKDISFIANPRFMLTLEIFFKRLSPDNTTIIDDLKKIENRGFRKNRRYAVEG